MPLLFGYGRVTDCPLVESPPRLSEAEAGHTVGVVDHKRNDACLAVTLELGRDEEHAVPPALRMELANERQRSDASGDDVRLLAQEIVGRQLDGDVLHPSGFAFTSRGPSGRRRVLT